MCLQFSVSPCFQRHNGSCVEWWSWHRPATGRGSHCCKWQKSGLGWGKNTEINANLDVMSCSFSLLPRRGIASSSAFFGAVALCQFKFVFALRMVQDYWKFSLWILSLYTLEALAFFINRLWESLQSTKMGILQEVSMLVWWHRQCLISNNIPRNLCYFLTSHSLMNSCQEGLMSSFQCPQD